MKLCIDTFSPIELLEGEYIEYHDGRDGNPFNLDASIAGIKDLKRAKLLVDELTERFPFPKYKMEQIKIWSANDITHEVLFSMSDFIPVIRS